MNYTSLCPPEPFGCKLSLPFDNGGNLEIGLHKGFVRLESSVQFGVVLVGTMRIFFSWIEKLVGITESFTKMKSLGFISVSAGVRLKWLMIEVIIGVSYGHETTRTRKIHNSNRLLAYCAATKFMNKGLNALLSITSMNSSRADGTSKPLLGKAGCIRQPITTTGYQ